MIPQDKPLKKYMSHQILPPLADFHFKSQPDICCEGNYFASAIPTVEAPRS